MRTKTTSFRTGLSHARSGSTLADTLVSTAVFGIMIVGLVYTQLFCMRYDELTNSKLGASDNARLGYDKLTSDIRGAKQWYIGYGDNSGFTPCGNATNQVGNALQISFTTDTNSFIRYFFDTNQCRLCRQLSGTSQFRVISQNLTNASGQGMKFIAQKYDGTQLSDLQFKYVIVTTLEFAQYQYPLTRVGPGYYYDYYRIQFKITSHNYN